MKGAGPSPRQSPRALRPDPGPAMSFFRRKGSEGRGAGLGAAGGGPSGSEAFPSARSDGLRAGLAGLWEGAGPPRGRTPAGPEVCAGTRLGHAFCRHTAFRRGWGGGGAFITENGNVLRKSRTFQNT